MRQAQPHTVNPHTLTVDQNPAYPKAVAEMKEDVELRRCIAEGSAINIYFATEAAEYRLFFMQCDPGLILRRRQDAPVSPRIWVVAAIRRVD
jgi:hypothetical protein